MLSLNNINKTFSASFRNNKNKLVLENINLGIKAKKILLIKGSNGSGKSTLLRIISGLLSYDFGEISSKDREDIESVRLVSNNDRSFFLPLTVKDNLNYFCSIFGSKDNSSYVREIFNYFDSINLLDERYSNLSTGQKKIVMLARALSSKPKILLLDEFFSNLDNELKQKSISFLKKFIADNNASVIFTSHQASDESIADEIYEIQNKVLIKVL